MERYQSGGGVCVRGRSPPWAFCLGCYTNLRKRTNYKSHRFYVARPSSKPVYWSQLMKRSTCQAPPSKKGHWVCADSDFSKKYPALAAGLCDAWWDDGKPREVWTLSLSFEADHTRLMLTDREHSQSAFTAAPTLADALELLNEAVASETLSWRKWKKK